MKTSLLSLCVLAVAAATLVSASGFHQTADLRSAHNRNPASTWRAGANERFEGKSYEFIQRQMGVLEVDPPAWMKPDIHVHTDFDMNDLPTHFDAREQWPDCPKMDEIRDQSDCGSCWAFGAVSAASDRICISTQGAFKPHLSAQDMLACCYSCGFGCNGGYPSAAWSYMKTTGVVTGGNYGDNSWCSAYSMPNCNHHSTGPYPNCGQAEYPTPSCPTSCDKNSTYPIPFAQDKIKFKSSYSVPSQVEQIQREIMTNGPVEVAFSVYSDFLDYKGGVYKYSYGNMLGGHAVKMLGWGVDEETNTPYWLIANSWNENWGEKGYFRIYRGNNHCGIEGQVVAGLYQ